MQGESAEGEILKRMDGETVLGTWWSVYYRPYANLSLAHWVFHPFMAMRVKENLKKGDAYLLKSMRDVRVKKVVGRLMSQLSTDSKMRSHLQSLTSSSNEKQVA